MKSAAEDYLALALALSPVAGWDLEREYRFHPTRKWRFDFAFPSQKLAIEIEGFGRHQTVSGYMADLEKYNEATRLGWRLLRFPARDKLKAHGWAALIKEVLCAR